jgi:predicted dehydrogenase
VVEWYHLPALKRSPDWQLLAICEPLVERRKLMQQLHPGVAAFASCTELLRYSDVEALLIATPPATHYPLAMQALEAGLHVLVEKPMALRVPDAAAMLDASRRAQRQLWVGFNRRFRRPYLSLQQHLAARPEADIRAVRCTFVFEAQRWSRAMSPSAEDTSGNGVLDDVAAHQVDLLPWLLGRSVQQVTAAHLEKDAAGLESLRYELKFAPGLVASCQASYGRRYSEQLEVRLRHRTFVTHPGGTLAVRWLPAAWLRPYCQLRTIWHLLAHKLTASPNTTLESFTKQLAAFAAAIRGAAQPSAGADATSGLYSVQAVQACRESLRTGGSRVPLLPLTAL